MVRLLPIPRRTRSSITTCLRLPSLSLSPAPPTHTASSRWPHPTAATCTLRTPPSSPRVSASLLLVLPSLSLSLPSSHINLALVPSHLLSLSPALPSLSAAGMWFLRRWTKAKALSQLTFTDGDSLEDCYLYKLSQARGLEHFRHVFFLASRQGQSCLCCLPLPVASLSCSLPCPCAWSALILVLPPLLSRLPADKYAPFYSARVQQHAEGNDQVRVSFSPSHALPSLPSLPRL